MNVRDKARSLWARRSRVDLDDLLPVAAVGLGGSLLVVTLVTIRDAAFTPFTVTLMVISCLCVAAASRWIVPAATALAVVVTLVWFTQEKVLQTASLSVFFMVLLLLWRRNVREALIFGTWYLGTLISQTVPYATTEQVVNGIFLFGALMLSFATVGELLGRQSDANKKLDERRLEELSEQRRAIARELHDGACVNLAAINMKVDALRDELSSDPALAQKMADIADDLETTYREVRGISHDLMSKSLDTTGLQTALEDLAARMQQAQPGLAVHFYTNYPLDRVSNLSKIHLYRIAQELLANVLKHARARSVNLQLLEDEGNLLLTVEDDGQGFDAASNGTDGIGLSNIRTRVEVLRGKMHLDSAPGKGTFISIEIPEAAIN